MPPPQRPLDEYDVRGEDAARLPPACPTTAALVESVRAQVAGHRVDESWRSEGLTDTQLVILSRGRREGRKRAIEAAETTVAEAHARDTAAMPAASMQACGRHSIRFTAFPNHAFVAKASRLPPCAASAVKPRRATLDVADALYVASG